MRAGLDRVATVLLLCVVLFDVEPALGQGVTAQVPGVFVDSGST